MTTGDGRRLVLLHTHTGEILEAVFGTLPSAVPCLVLNYRLTHD